MCQVTSESDVQKAIDLASEKYGTLTTAVNCAGIGVAIRTLSKRGPHPLNEFQVKGKPSSELFIYIYSGLAGFI